MVRLDPSLDLLNNSMDSTTTRRRSTRLSKNSDFNGRHTETTTSSLASTSTISDVDACNFSLANTLLNDNLTCNCCLDILKNPVSLPCGHSYCELCLVNWYNASKNRQCPVCREKWYGAPKPNQALVTIIKRLVENDPTNSATYNRTLTVMQKRTVNKFRKNSSREQIDEAEESEETEYSEQNLDEDVEDEDEDEYEDEEDIFEINTSRTSSENSSNRFVPARTSTTRMITTRTTITASPAPIRRNEQKNDDCFSTFILFVIVAAIMLWIMSLSR